MTRQRSRWCWVNQWELPHVTEGPIAHRIEAQVHQRNVHDGHLTAMVAIEPGIGWHLSISHRTNTNPPKPGRYPTWDEIAHARYELLPDDLDFVMHLPPMDEYVAVHDTTFHLHQHPEPATERAS